MQGNSPKNCCELSIRAFDKSSLPAHRHRECRRTSAARRFPKEVEYGRVPREKHTPLKVSSAQSCRSAHLASFRIKGLAAETSARNAVLRSLSRVPRSNRRKWPAQNPKLSNIPTPTGCLNRGARKLACCLPACSTPRPRRGRKGPWPKCNFRKEQASKTLTRT